MHTQTHTCLEHLFRETLHFYLAASLPGNTLCFNVSDPDKAECFAWLFGEAIVHVVKTSFTVSDEKASEECEFFWNFTKETGFSARSSLKIPIPVFISSVCSFPIYSVCFCDSLPLPRFWLSFVLHCEENSGFRTFLPCEVPSVCCLSVLLRKTQFAIGRFCSVRPFFPPQRSRPLDLDRLASASSARWELFL